MPAGYSFERYLNVRSAFGASFAPGGTSLSFLTDITGVAEVWSVPIGEAEQIVAALRARDVPVEYLRFADEGHGLVKRANRLIAYPAIARFLDAYAHRLRYDDVVHTRAFV